MEPTWGQCGGRADPRGAGAQRFGRGQDLREVGRPPRFFDSLARFFFSGSSCFRGCAFFVSFRVLDPLPPVFTPWTRPQDAAMTVSGEAAKGGPVNASRAPAHPPPARSAFFDGRRPPLERVCVYPQRPQAQGGAGERAVWRRGATRMSGLPAARIASFTTPPPRPAPPRSLSPPSSRAQEEQQAAGEG